MTMENYAALENRFNEAMRLDEEVQQQIPQRAKIVKPVQTQVSNLLIYLSSNLR
jgi:hypothetical protein